MASIQPNHTCTHCLVHFALSLPLEVSVIDCDSPLYYGSLWGSRGGSELLPCYYPLISVSCVQFWRDAPLFDPSQSVKRPSLLTLHLSPLYPLHQNTLCTIFASHHPHDDHRLPIKQILQRYTSTKGRHFRHLLPFTIRFRFGDEEG